MKTPRPALSQRANDPALAQGEIRASTAQYWRPASTELHGARLYCFAFTATGSTDWQVEITVLGVEVRRRFDSEANARAWLATLQEPEISKKAPGREKPEISWTAVVRHGPTMAWLLE
jgi:hypothetical protein